MLTDAGMQLCCEWLMYDEGFEQFPYDDETGEGVKAPKGNLSIGIGFNLQGVGLSLNESLMILRHRIARLFTTLEDRLEFFSELDEIRQITLINLAYNLGVAGLLKFHDTLLFLAVKDYLNASKELLDSKAAIMLSVRYERLAEALLTGKYPKAIPGQTKGV